MGKRGTSVPSVNSLRVPAGRDPNPVVSATQFAHLTLTTGGATMNAHDGRFTIGGQDDGYAVGGMRADKPIQQYGERSSSGKKLAPSSTRRRIPGRNVGAIPGSVRQENEATGDPGGSDLPLSTVLNQRDRIRRMTRANPDSNLGSWSLGNGKVSIDASEVETDLAMAKTKGIRRGEDAIFDMKNLKDIELPTSRKQKKR